MTSNSTWLSMSFFCYLACLKSLKKCVAREENNNLDMLSRFFTHIWHIVTFNEWMKSVSERKLHFCLVNPHNACLDFQVIVPLHRFSLLSIL